MLAGSGELLVFTDADGAYGPGDVQRVVQALETAPVAIGTRGPDTAAPLARQVASRAFNYALHLLSDLPFTDTQCGLKGFRRQAARQLFGRARACSGSRVRILADGRRMLGEVWSVRQELGPDHPSGGRACAQ